MSARISQARISQARISQAEPAAAAAPDTEVTQRGSARLPRIAAGLSLAGAGVLIFAGFLMTPSEASSATAAGLRTLAAHPAQTQLAAVVLHFGYLLLIPAAFALVHLARRGARRLTYAGLVLTVLGAGLSGLLISDFFELSLAQHLPLATAARVDDAGKQYALAALIAKPTALAAVLGLVLLAVAVWRAGWVSWWPAVVMLVGWVVAFSSSTLLRGGVGSGLVLIGLVALAARVLRAGDGEWEAGRPA
jgi:hypothetical protein